MVVKGRERVALVLCLLWAIVVATAFIISETYGLNLYWYTVLISLLLLIAGLAVLFGLIQLFFPFIFLPKEDLSVYNVEKISFVLGVPMAAVSCVIIFISMSVFVIWAIVGIAIAIEIGGIYVSVAKRFRADTQPRY